LLKIQEKRENKREGKAKRGDPGKREYVGR